MLDIGIGEGLKCGDKIVATAQLKLVNGALPFVENQIAEMIGHFGLVLFDVGERTEQALLFAIEQNEANGAARALAGTQDGFRSAEDAGGTHAVVGGAFGQIPGIEVRADDQNFLRVFAAANFSHGVGGLHRAIAETILHVQARANFFACGEEIVPTGPGLPR